MRIAIALVVSLLLAFAPIAELAKNTDAEKVRVLAAPGVNTVDPKDWGNTLTISDKGLVVECKKCTPIQTITIDMTDISELRYGGNAYHHWVAGIVSGAFSLGVGLIIGLMPHHEHYFSIGLKSGKVLGIQADKGNYREVAGRLQNATSLPIIVSPKDAHFLNGFRTQIEEEQKTDSK
jgi:hypothetical protein